jgi:DamX protein
LSDTEELFSTPESEARLDLIKHLIENSELVPLVRGVSGIGKTLLATRLQANAPENWAVCHFDAESIMQPERLLAQIARCYGLPDVKEENIQRLVERFEMLRKRGTIPVLLIDDAQELPPTSLITLLRLYEHQVGGGPLVSLVLFANEQIDLLLSTPQLQIMSPHSIQVIDLSPLTSEEADAFMRHLLKVEDLDQRLVLDAARLNRIYRETQGAPGPLRNAILKAVGEAGSGANGPSVKLTKPVILAAVPVALLILLLLVFQGPVNRLFSPEPKMTGVPSVAETPQEKSVQPLAPPDTPEGNGVESGEPVTDRYVLPKPAAMREQQWEVPAVPGQGVALNEERQQGSAEEGVVAPQTRSDMVTRPLTVEERPKMEEIDGPVLSESPKIEETSEQVGSEPSPPPVATTVPQVDSAIASQQPAPEPVSQEELKATEPVAQAEKQTAERTEQSAEPGQEKIAKWEGASMLRSRQWLSEQFPGGYTIQLLAVENIESIQPVVAKHKLEEEAFTIRTERMGRPWYPLLWGVFESRAEAMAAIKGLPPALRKGGAWARTLASLYK